jgi:phosphatidylinositol alpha-1,6-mannosyltransferase
MVAQAVGPCSVATRNHRDSSLSVVRLSKASSRRRILALLPGLAGHGGIQQHNRMLCGVVTGWASAREIDFNVVSLADPPHWQDERYLTTSVTGCQGDRYRFAVQSTLALARPYDLLIVGVVDFGILLAVPWLLRRHAPVVTIVHGIEVWKPLPITRRAALKRADRILSVSNYTSEKVSDLHGVGANRIVTVPIPLDPEFIAESEAFHAEGRPGHESGVLSIARMNRIDAEKGIETLIRAVAQMGKDASGLRCVIVGDGDDRLRLEALARELSVDHAVRFAGAVSDAELHAYLAGTRVFALPSRKEGFGIVFLEAMQYSKPVVAGAHGGIPEVVENGVTGWLVEYGDAEGLAKALGSLVTDETTRAAMGQAGHKAITERFGFERFRVAIEAMLDDLVPGQASV